MQDRYVGDIGDYVKLSLLRSLAPNHSLGVGWWLYPDESHNGDGRHIDYLRDSLKWRGFDETVFDGLRRIVDGGARRVQALEQAGLVPGATYFNELIPTVGEFHQRALAREVWFRRLCLALAGANVIFLDPDNGLETKNFKPGAKRAGKSVSLSELQALRAPNRTLIVYHHQTRMKNGHDYELGHWGKRLHEAGFASVDALRASAYSARAFFFLEATPVVRQRMALLAQNWGERRLVWHEHLHRRNT
jgi:hypothetical protein